MRRRNRLSAQAILVFLIMFLLTFSFISVEARKQHFKKNKCHKHHREESSDGAQCPGSAPSPLPSNDHSTTSKAFNILSFKAKGNGHSDDSKALLAAWKAACKVPSATVEIPGGQGTIFSLSPLHFKDLACLALFFSNQNGIKQIDGTLLAPPKVNSWSKSSLFQWMNFKWAQNFTIQGSGTVDGQGSNWWIQKKLKHNTNIKPTALRFYASNNITVKDIRIINSPQCHLKFDNSAGVRIDNITISSPDSSPNTDGIHLQNTRNVEVHHSNIGCGDDCVSIQTGCSNVSIHHINCGPGHGISLGGLGKDRSVGCISNINIDHISFQNTISGVRIKTWQGGLGSVKNVSFSNIQVNDVKVPVVIDQYYCDKGFCKNQTEAVAISDVKYDNIIGTYSVQPIHLACSNEVPCTDVDLIDIQLKPKIGNENSHKTLCWNTFGKSKAPLLPSIIDYCLRRGGGSIKGTARSHDHLC